MNDTNKHFTYNLSLLLDAVTITNGSNHDLKARIDPDTNFEVHEIRTSGTDKVYLTFKSGESLSLANQAFNAALIGAGQNKLMFPEGNVVLTGGKDFIVNVLNKTGSSITHFDVTLIGRKV